MAARSAALARRRISMTSNALQPNKLCSRVIVNAIVLVNGLLNKIIF